MIPHLFRCHPLAGITAVCPCLVNTGDGFFYRFCPHYRHAIPVEIVNLIMAWIMRQMFVCRGCGACCRIPDGIVRVSDDEIARIAAFLGQREEAFIATETELAPDRKGLILKSRPDGACAYLSDDNRCRIHPVKPDKCRTFPYEWTNPDSINICPGLQACRCG